MEKAKQLWTLAKANPKISAAVVVVIVAIYFLANQDFMLNGLSECKHTCNVCAGQERISL